MARRRHRRRDLITFCPHIHKGNRFELNSTPDDRRDGVRVVHEATHGPHTFRPPSSPSGWSRRDAAAHVLAISRDALCVDDSGDANKMAD